MSENIALRHCPFCGGKAEFEVEDEEHRGFDDELIHRVIYTVCCGNTGWYSSPNEAANAWNTRV